MPGARQAWLAGSVAQGRATSTSLEAALAGDAAPLVDVADDVLALVGGRLWSGFRLDAPAEASVTPHTGRA